MSFVDQVKAEVAKQLFLGPTETLILRRAIHDGVEVLEAEMRDASWSYGIRGTRVRIGRHPMGCPTDTAQKVADALVEAIRMDPGVQQA